MPISLRDAGFWLSVAACVVAQVAIVRSVFVSRGTPSAPAVPRPRLAIELGWSIVPAIGLAYLLWFTWQKLHAA